MDRDLKNMTMADISHMYLSYKKKRLWVVTANNGTTMGLFLTCQKAMRAVENAMTEPEDEIQWYPAGGGWELKIYCTVVVKRLEIDAPLKTE